MQGVLFFWIALQKMLTLPIFWSISTMYIQNMFSSPMYSLYSHSLWIVKCIVAKLNIIYEYLIHSYNETFVCVLTGNQTFYGKMVFLCCEAVTIFLFSLKAGVYWLLYYLGKSSKIFPSNDFTVHPNPYLINTSNSSEPFV